MTAPRGPRTFVARGVVRVREASRGRRGVGLVGHWHAIRLRRIDKHRSSPKSELPAVERGQTFEPPLDFGVFFPAPHQLFETPDPLFETPKLTRRTQPRVSSRRLLLLALHQSCPVGGPVLTQR